MNSLSEVEGDSQKFSEIIDKMSVPTVQTYKHSTKEKPFRRPTQNPIRQNRSSASARAEKSKRDKEREERKKKLIAA